MSKSLSFSACLALALGFCGTSFAGGIFHKTTAYASSQCETASPQSIVASPQSECGTTACGPVKKHCLSNMMAKFHKPKCYTYEWVLKKKRVHGHQSPCASPTCDTCSSVQYPSAQVEYGSTQMAPTSSTQIAPVEAPVAPAAPAAPAPPAPPAPTASNGGVLFLTNPAGN